MQLNEVARYRVTPVRAMGLVLAASVIVLGSTLLSQYAGGLKPCVLASTSGSPTPPLSS